MSVPLFTPITFRGLTIRNRIGVSPMCQYSAEDGFANDWHLVHIGSRALGGAGLIIMEATGVTPAGRITPSCSGIWKDEHIAPLQRVTDFAKQHGAAIGLQLAHAGRKASMASPFKGGQRLMPSQGGWETLAPSPIPFQSDFAAPHELSKDEIKQLVDDFVAAAKRAVRAGFQIIEIHGAHGYLLHEFYSPLSNKRQDEYGGTEENRFRLICEVARAIRACVPQEIVLATRLSCSDWTEGGITIDDTVRLSAALKKEGVDFIDCSSGALIPDAKIPVGPNYQVPFARAIRDKVGIPTAAVGMINEAAQANDIIVNGEADMVFLARAMLRDPYWALHAADVLGAEMDVPQQYLRGYRSEQLARPRQKKSA